MERLPYLRLDVRDNVIVALKDLPKGTLIRINDTNIILKDNIPAKHKFFMDDLNASTGVIMYGILVGKVRHEVKKGMLMNVSNTKHAANAYSYKYPEIKWIPPDAPKYENRTFNGYYRSDGRVGTANYWLFIPTVFCEARNLDVIREALCNELGYAVTGKYKKFTRSLVNAYHEGRDLDMPDSSLFMGNDNKERVFKNVDGIKFLNHQGGCGGTRQDSSTLSALLASYADHPNLRGLHY